MSKLADLLDFGIITNIDSLYEHYYQTAAQLFYSHEIKTEKGDRYFITDLELYLYNNEFFKDPFMGARHHTQLTNGRFYVHRNAKNNHDFKKANYIGLDITCGNFNGCFGGLLVKGIQNVKTAEEIFGSAKVLHKLVGTSDKIDLRKKSWSNTELLKLHNIDDSDVFKSKLFKLTESNKLSSYSETYVGQRKNLKKIDSPLKAKFERYGLKCVSKISNYKTDDMKLLQVKDKYFYKVA